MRFIKKSLTASKNPGKGRPDRLEEELGRGRVLADEPMSRHTYFRIGGPAELFYTARNAEELEKAVILANKFRVPWFILGGGSNILAGDLGVGGLVIKNEADKISRRGRVLTAESGAPLNRVVACANRQGLGGLEPFMSVPGTVGGAIYNNSHFRPERNEFIGNLVQEAEILEQRVKKGEGKEGLESRWGRKTVGGDWFKFGYDYSRLQEEKAVVLAASFLLEAADPEELRQKSLKAVKERRDRQPLGLCSSGCIFKNPPGDFAGRLIEAAGLKGRRVGGAAVSEKHANFIVSDGAASAKDVLELMALVKRELKKAAGVSLAPEIFLLGRFKK